MNRLTIFLPLLAAAMVVALSLNTMDVQRHEPSRFEGDLQSFVEEMHQGLRNALQRQPEFVVLHRGGGDEISHDWSSNIARRKAAITLLDRLFRLATLLGQYMSLEPGIKLSDGLAHEHVERNLRLCLLWVYAREEGTPLALLCRHIKSGLITPEEAATFEARARAVLRKQRVQAFLREKVAEHALAERLRATPWLAEILGVGEQPALEGSEQPAAETAASEAQPPMLLHPDDLEDEGRKPATRRSCSRSRCAVCCCLCCLLAACGIFC